jgi:FkbM family methyltransferase
MNNDIKKKLYLYYKKKSMSTKYFILSKPSDKTVDSNSENQIVFLNRSQTFILPQINLEYYSKHGLFENQLIEWSKQFCKEDKVFLDIGAHTGTYSISLAPHCKEIHSFEPQKMTYYALCGSVALSNATNITCHNIGLGSTEQVGPLKLKIVSNDGGGSSIHANGNILREEIINIHTLDSLHLTDIGFIKMDVEENELYVILGAIETLKSCGYPPILFESNTTNDILFNFIQNLGYKIIKISGCSNMFLACS